LFEINDVQERTLHEEGQSEEGGGQELGEHYVLWEVVTNVKAKNANEGLNVVDREGGEDGRY
jgi:hypothetical protein